MFADDWGEPNQPHTERQRRLDKLKEHIHRQSCHSLPMHDFTINTYTVCVRRNFHWVKISSSPATFVLNKLMVENFFTNVNAAISSAFII